MIETRIRDTFRAEAFPCNPLPFLIALTEHVRTEGTKAIRDDLSKAALLVVIQQAYGQCAYVDSCTEHDRLCKRLLPIGVSYEEEDAS